MTLSKFTTVQREIKVYLGVLISCNLPEFLISGFPLCMPPNPGQSRGKYLLINKKLTFRDTALETCRELSFVFYLVN